MKKSFFCLSVILSCLTLTMTSCGDDREGDVDMFNITYPYEGHVSAEGGTVNVVWRKGIVIYDNVYTAPWEYGLGNVPQPTGSWEKVNTTNEIDVLTGEGIVIAPVGSKADGKYPGVSITLSPNTTGKKRCFKIFDSAFDSGAHIFQDCTELNE